MDFFTLLLPGYELSYHGRRVMRKLLLRSSANEPGQGTRKVGVPKNTLQEARLLVSGFRLVRFSQLAPEEL